MKLNELKIDHIKKYIRVDGDEDDSLLEIIYQATISTIKGYTGLNDEEINNYDDLSIVALILCAEMYDNRQYTADKNNINPTAKTILDLHSRRLL